MLWCIGSGKKEVALDHMRTRCAGVFGADVRWRAHVVWKKYLLFFGIEMPDSRGRGTLCEEKRMGLQSK